MDTLSLLLHDIRLEGARFIRSQLQAPWSLSLENQGVACFHLVSSGQCELVFDHAATETPTSCYLNTGDVVILPNGQAHRLITTGDGVAQTFELQEAINEGKRELRGDPSPGPTSIVMSGYFKFDSDLAKPLLSALPHQLLHRDTHMGGPTWLSIGLMFLENELAEVRTAQQAVINRVAELLLIQCLRNYVDSLPEGSSNWLRALKDPALSATLEAIHQNPAEQWSVPQLADLACLSRSAFASRFGRVLGVPPLTYLTQHRMRLAAAQLRESGQPIRLIANQVGYHSEAAFSQAFKRTYDCSPSAYRDRHQ